MGIATLILTTISSDVVESSASEVHPSGQRVGVIACGVLSLRIKNVVRNANEHRKTF